MPPEPFRDDDHAALARVSSLEEENERLRAQLREKLEPPAEGRTMPLWLVALFVIVPVLLLGTGLFAAFLLRKHAPAEPPAGGGTQVRTMPALQVGQRLG